MFSLSLPVSKCTGKHEKSGDRENVAGLQDKASLSDLKPKRSKGILSTGAQSGPWWRGHLDYQPAATTHSRD